LGVVAILSESQVFSSPPSLEPLGGFEAGVERSYSSEITSINYRNNKMAEKLHTGEIVEDSGIYRIVGSRDEIVLTTGDRVPPIDKEAADIVLVRKAKHSK